MVRAHSYTCTSILHEQNTVTKGAQCCLPSTQAGPYWQVQKLRTFVCEAIEHATACSERAPQRQALAKSHDQSPEASTEAATAL